VTDRLRLGFVRALAVAAGTVAPFTGSAPAIDGILDCDLEELGFLETADMEGTAGGPASIPIDVARREIVGLEPR
jgi:hypothetical protein